MVNRNSERTNVILGRRTRTVLGPGVIEDTLAGVPLRMGVHEFYQVNTPAAEVLYAKAREYAGLKPDEFFAGPVLRHGHDRAFDAGGLQTLSRR